ncbi:MULTISPECIES: hypothetical protein [Autumnicola]|uniref:GIY-YIG homing endonuclease n=2 Tax=Autumnicola TaxID=3160927 RepID=A0ABU3CU41_9FLAO|nr:MULTISPECIES: hypothetical protein [unclassified Zunongwangia]MDT0649753.1 hypothetical protein [Zunongwangia sp. F297]MDT0687832.1 hypothetical protein [Zunongwangia sp. F225]
MAAHPTPIIHSYKEINPGKYRSVKHYELAEVINGTSLLSETINVQKDRNYAKSMPDYWLKIRQGKKWSRPITGLFKTTVPGIYIGDSQKKKNLILAQFTENKSCITLYYFKNYYTRDLNKLIEQTVS